MSASKKLKLQRAAMKAYSGGDYHSPGMKQSDVEERGDLDGDSLALFVWREVGEANGDRDESIRMLATAQQELQEVIDAL